MPEAVHVAIDAVGMRRFSGGPVVLLDLIDALAADEGVRRVTVFVSPPSRRDFSIPEHDKVASVACEAYDASRPALLRWVTRELGRAAERHGADGVVSLNALGLARLPTVVLFQQQLMFAPEAVRRMPFAFRARLRALRLLSKHACRRAALVVAQAPHVARSLREQFGVPATRIHVCLPDVRWTDGSAPEPAERRSNRLVYVGTDNPYKSLDTLLTAFSALRRELPSLELAVTLPPSARLNRAGVRALGTLPRPTVRRLLGEATALVMPSLAETIGLPLVEALDAGCPVVAADLAYARDVCGDAAVYFDAADAMSCARACRAVLTDDALRARLREAGARRIATLRAARPYPELAQRIRQTLAGRAR